MRSGRKSFCCALSLVIGFLVAIAAPAGAYTVMAIGDSITAGYVPGNPNPTYNGGYIPYLSDRLGTDYSFIGTQGTGSFLHEGYPGYTVKYESEKLIESAIAYHPEIILIHIGTNDLNSSWSGSETTAYNVLKLMLEPISAAYKNSSTIPDVYLAQIIPACSPTAQTKVPFFNDALSKQNYESLLYLNLKLVDMYGALDPTDFADDLHPDDSGYEKMAAAWGAAMGVAPSPVPIPAPIFLLGAGLAGLAAIRRRFKHPSGPRIG